MIPNRTHVDMLALLEGTHSDIHTMTRQAIVKALVTGDETEFYPDSMVLQSTEGYRGAKMPMKFAFPNQDPSLYKADPKKSLNTWDYMEPAFQVMEKGVFYHLLCFRYKNSRSKSYFPVLIVRIVPRVQAPGVSKRMHELALSSPGQFMLECCEDNIKWMAALDAS